MTAVLAVDFGASSVRVCRVDISTRPPTIEVLDRQAHEPVRDSDGSLRWDWPRLTEAMERGLTTGLDAGPVASIGVDTWGVDYGLLDAAGELVAPPFSYHDDRTDGYDVIIERLGGEAPLYKRTGLQIQPFNTIFQVAAHRPDELGRARHLLTLPELLVHHLTGEITAERTTAGTTGLVDLATGTWSPELSAAIGLDPSVLPEILTATTHVGDWRGTPVHLVGGHDTGSAVVAVGADVGSDTAFVSSGTWLLVGREQVEADVSEWARSANFTNEAGAFGGYRFLRNVTGFWLLEQCRKSWGSPAVGELLAAAEAVTEVMPTVDALDPRFLHPDDMVAEITQAAGLSGDAPPAVVVRCIVESLAETTARVLDQLGGVSGVVLLGGGVNVDLFRRRLCEVSGLPVRAGATEAAALGNALVQGIAIGVYDHLSDARSALGV